MSDPLDTLFRYELDHCELKQITHALRGKVIINRTTGKIVALQKLSSNERALAKFIVGYKGHFFEGVYTLKERPSATNDEVSKVRLLLARLVTKG